MALADAGALAMTVAGAPDPVMAPGDIVLYHRPGSAFGVSRIIELVTGSPYTHAMLAIDHERVVDAVPAAGPDIEIGSIVDRCDGLTAPDRAVLFARRHNRSAAPILSGQLERAVHDVARRDEAGIEPEFSVANLVALAILRNLKPVDATVDPDHRQLWRAVMHVANDGRADLFCSEFVYLVLRAAGHTPLLPERPFIELPPAEPGPSGVVDRVKEWLGAQSEIRQLLHSLQVSLPDFKEVLSEISEAYRKNLPLGPLDVSNFVAPVDLAHSPSYTLVGWRGAGDDAWHPGPPPAS